MTDHNGIPVPGDTLPPVRRGKSEAGDPSKPRFARMIWLGLFILFLVGAFSAADQSTEYSGFAAFILAMSALGFLASAIFSGAKAVENDQG